MKFRLLFFLTLLFWLSGFALAEVEEITTLYIVRHAEKEANGDDPNLTPEGYLRAHRLLGFLRKRPIDAVYSTDTRRTRQTAQPVAEANQLPINPYSFDDKAAAEWADGFISTNRGKNVLVVGHSNTVPGMASALSGEKTDPLDHDDYDDIFVVSIYHSKDSTTRQLQHHFGGILKPHRYHQVVTRDIPLAKSEDLSAVAVAGDSLLVGADEEGHVQLLRWAEDFALVVGPRFSLETDGELDLEGLARRGNTFYALGSHSRGRNNVSPSGRKSRNRTWKKNRKRFAANEVIAQLSRRQIVEFSFETFNDAPVVKQRMNLQPLLESDPFLEPFTRLASKENGVDLEGLAATKDGSLFVGFRGPVLRSGYVPILKLTPSEPSNYNLLFANFEGAGVRDMVAVDDGLLVLTGPIGDSEFPYRLYHWDGADTLPGERAPDEPQRGEVTLLGEVPAPTSGKAEGLTVFESDSSYWTILIVYDGIRNGFPTSFRVKKP